MIKGDYIEVFHCFYQTTLPKTAGASQVGTGFHIVSTDESS